MIFEIFLEHHMIESSFKHFLILVSSKDIRNNFLGLNKLLK